MPLGISFGGDNRDPSEELRHDWVSPYSYCGVAPLGVSELDNSWTIHRIEVIQDGTVIVLSATNVSWNDRYTVIYT